VSNVRVLVSAFACEPDKGSEPGNGWEWARGLAATGNEVHLLTTPRAQPAIEAAIGREGLGITPHFLGERARRFGLPEHLDKYRRYVAWQRDACSVARSIDFEVAHHVSWGSLHLGSDLWRTGRPLIYGPIGGGQTLPTHLRPLFQEDLAQERLRNIATRQLLGLNVRSRTTLSYARTVLVTNTATHAASVRLGATDVRPMLAEGIAADLVLKQSRRPPVGSPTVLWVGRLIPRKAPTLMVRAFSSMATRRHANLVIVGDGPLRGEVQRAADESGVGDRITLTGRLDWRQVLERYLTATVFVFSSLRDSSSSQFLEAMASGLPAVALNHHGVGDHADSRATRLVSVDSSPSVLVAELAAAIDNVVGASADEWQTMSDAARCWAANHTWQRKVEVAQALYAEVRPA
jgi:glycosyltransferase involved in cell wall biosynthesis